MNDVCPFPNLQVPSQEVILKSLPEKYISMSHVNDDSSTHSTGQSLLGVVMDMHLIPREIRRVVRHLRD